MAKVYAELIMRGEKTIDDVPSWLRADVEKLLDEMKSKIDTLTVSI